MPELRVFFDGSVIESFLSGREQLVSRVYGLKAGEVELEIETAKGPVEGRFWKLEAISGDRLTA